MAYRAVAVESYLLPPHLFEAAFAATATALGGAIDEATATEAVDRQYRATSKRPCCGPTAWRHWPTLRAGLDPRAGRVQHRRRAVRSPARTPRSARRDRRTDELRRGRLVQAGCRRLPPGARPRRPVRPSRRCSSATVSATMSRVRRRSACGRHGWRPGPTPTPAMPSARRGDLCAGRGGRPGRPGCGPMSGGAPAALPRRYPGGLCTDPRSLPWSEVARARSSPWTEVDPGGCFDGHRATPARPQPTTCCASSGSSTPSRTRRCPSPGRWSRAATRRSSVRRST